MSAFSQASRKGCHQGHARSGWQNRFRHALDCSTFRRQRQTYYQYLADLLQGMRGSRSLRDVFMVDGFRYGGTTWRGRLCMRWSTVYEVTGGDLYATWTGAIPHDELNVLKHAQSRGNVALNQTLSELAAALAMTKSLQRALSGTFWTMVIALVLTACVFMALPYYTVPQLLSAFGAVPEIYYGSNTLGLIGLSRFIQQFGWVGLFMAAVACVGVRWSLACFTGKVRSVLDRVSVWRIYRYMHSQRLLAMLMIVLGSEGPGAIQLRTALMLLRDGASRWQAWHLEALIHRLDQGLPPTSVFDTRLFDREHRWFLADMIAARGLEQGLAFTSERLREHIRHQLIRQVQRWRWLVLFACLATLMGLTLWHYSVIDELRRAMINFYAGQ